VAGGTTSVVTSGPGTLEGAVLALLGAMVCACAVFFVIMIPARVPAVAPAPTQAATMVSDCSPGAINAVAFSPDSQQAVSAGADCAVTLWRVGDAAVQRTFIASWPITDVTFLPDGRRLAVASQSGLWVLQANDLLLVNTLAGSGVIAVSPDGQRLARADQSNTVYLSPLDGEEITQVFFGHAAAVTAIAFSPDGTLLATGSLDRTIRLWHVQDGSQAARLEGHTHGIQSVAFSADGQLLASTAGTNLVRVFAVPDGELLTTLTGPFSQATGAVFSAQGEALYAFVDYQRVCQWRLPDLVPVRLDVLATGQISAGAVSPDGQTLMLGYGSGQIEFFDLNESRGAAASDCFHANP
jgi:WD40 repeat protein